MKKILYVITRLEPCGTMENIMDLISGIISDYEIVLVLGSKNTDVERIKSHSIKYKYKIIFINELIREIAPIYDLISLWKLCRIVRKEKPNILHTHTSKAGFLGRLAGKLAKIKNVVHTPHGHIFYGYFGKIKTKLFVLLEKIASKFTKKIIVLSHSEREDHLRLNIGNAEQFVVIPNGVDMDKFNNLNTDVNNKKKQIGVTDGSKVIGVIGRLTPVKGHIYFTRAMEKVTKEIKNLKAIFVGSGELEEELKKEINKLRLNDYIIFLGKRQDVPEILKICDLVVLPSLNEGFGLSIVEAQAAGKPVIATKVGGIPEVVKDGETGILVSPKDSDALADSIIALINDESKMKSIAERAKQRVRENFTKESMIRRLKELYETL